MKRMLLKLLSFTSLVVTFFIFSLFIFCGSTGSAYHTGDKERSEVPGEPGVVKRSHIPYVKIYKAQQAPTINVNISQIEVSQFPTIKAYAQVTDGNGQEITGLTTSNFSLTEQVEGEVLPTQEQITVEEMAVETAIKVAIVIDSSGSMGWRYGSTTGIAAAKEAAKAFVDNMASLCRST